MDSVQKAYWADEKNLISSREKEEHGEELGAGLARQRRESRKK